MGIFSKHKGKGANFHLFLHIHSLSPFPASRHAVAVQWERKGKRGSTRAVAPTTHPGKAWGTFEFEETQHVPCTLYPDPAGKPGFRGLGPFERKELQLSVVDASSKQRAVLGTATLNLAEYAGAEKLQQTLPVVVERGVAKVAGGAPKLLVTISCTESEAAPAIAAVSSFSEVGDLPTTMSTDDEGGSRPSSRFDSRPSSRAEERPAAAPAAGTAAAARGLNGRGAALSAVRESEGSEAQGGARRLSTFDSDGILRDDSLDVGGEPQQAQRAAQPQQSGASSSQAVPVLTGGSVKRNLGSALEKVESGSRSSAGGGQGGGEEGEEVQSRPASRASPSPSRERPGSRAAAQAPPGSPKAAAAPAGALAAGAAAGAAGAALAHSGSRGHTGASVHDDTAAAKAATSAVAPSAPGEGLLSPPPAAAGPETDRDPDTPLDATLPGGGLLSPQPWSTGQSSLSAGGDPAVPFTVRPTTQRRFVRDDAGTAQRRWMWRNQPGGSGRPSPDKLPAGAGAAAAPAEQPSAAQASEGAPTVSEQQEQAESGPSHKGAPVAADVEAARPPSSLAEMPDPFRAAAAVAAVATAAGEAAGGGGGAAATHRAGRQYAKGERAASGFHLPPSREESLMYALASPHSSTLVVGGGDANTEALLRELRAAAALESAVYLAGGSSTFLHAGGAAAGGAASASGPATSRRLHAPARRLARTVVSLGRQEGPAFALRAVKAIKAVCGAAAGDLHRLAFWWSNVMQLRWMVWALQHPGGAAGAAGNGAEAGGGLMEESSYEAGWLAEVLAPALLDLEATLFDDMLKLLWWGVLLQHVTSSEVERLPPLSAAPSPAVAQATPPAGKRGAAAGLLQTPPRRTTSDLSGTPGQGTPRSFETPEEEAVHRWVQGLNSVLCLLNDPYRPAPAPRGHLKLLHRQLLVGLLRRLDTLLFRKLLQGPEEGKAGGRGPFSSTSARNLLRSTSFMEDVLGGAPVPLDPAVLPFQKGPLTFGVGVSLKMAVSRFTQWAADAGVKEEKVARSSTELSDYRLFPCLRATADLLMMPKEVLTDSEIRREVVPGLPLRRVVQILQRFEPDESAPDPVPPDLLEQLEAETPTSAAPPSPTVKRSEEYTPPAEVALLQEGLISTASLRMDEESEDELETLAEQYSEEGGGAQRFVLLKDLWAHAA